MPESGPVAFPQRRRQDLRGPGRPLFERVILTIAGVAVLAGVLWAGWWLIHQSAGSGPIRDGAPNWSHDSKQVIFTSEVGGQGDLYVADRAGGPRHQLTNTPGQEGGAAFSPDGQWIAFHSDRDGNFEIYVMRIDGTEARRLTNDPGIDQSPAWSFDSRRLVFMSNRANPDFDVFRMDLDGANSERVTTTGSNRYPQVSPDGGQIALQMNRDVYVMSLAARTFRRITHDPANGLHPAWSPDGRRIAFASSRNGRSEIFIARSDASDPQSVVTMAGDALEPRWSPDGNFIAFVHEPDGDIAHGKAGTQRIVYVVELSTDRVIRISR